MASINSGVTKNNSTGKAIVSIANKNGPFVNFTANYFIHDDHKLGTQPA